MADYDLGTASGTIQFTYDQSGIRQATRGLDQFQQSMRNTQHNLQSVARTSGIATAALGAGLVYAANTAIDFEKQISAIGAVSNATEAELEQIRKKALQLGADTAFSAAQAGQAMEELVKAGLSVEDVLNGAADATVALAAAGEVELAEAATIASNAMNAFNLEARDMAHVADLIAGAANASAIDVREFGFSLAQSGAVANLAGVSFDDLTTAIALMGNAGIKGSDAGTSLKTMLQNLSPVTNRQKELMRELGIVTEDGSNRFYDAQGNLKSLAEVSGILNSSMKDLTAQQKALALETIFGSDAIRAAAILTKSGSEGFREMAGAIGQITAKDVAAKRLDNVAGALEQLKGSAETAAIVLGTALLPIIRKAAEFITGLVNRFSEMDPRWQKLIAFALVAATAIGALITVLAGVGAVIAGLAAASGLGTVLAVILGIVAAVVAVGAAFKALYDQSAPFRDLIRAIGDAFARIRAMAVAAYAPLVAFIRNQVLPALARIRDEFLKRLQPAFESIQAFINQHVVPAFAQIKDAIQSAMPTIIEIARFLVNVLGAAFTTIGSILGTLIPIIMKLVGPAFSLLGTVIAFLIRNLPTIVSIIKTVIKVFQTIAKVVAVAIIAPFFAIWEAAKFVFNAVRGFVEEFVRRWEAVWSVIGPPVKAAFGLIVSIIQTAWSIISAIFSVFRTVIMAVFGAIAAVIVPPVRAAFNTIMDIIKLVMHQIETIITAAWAIIKKVWDTVYQFTVTPIINAFKLIRDFISARMTEGQGIISSVWEAIKGFFRRGVDAIIAIINGVKKVVDKIREFFGQLKAAADKGVGPLIDFVKGIPGRVVSALGNLGSLLYEKGKSLVQGFINGIKSMFGALANTASNLVSTVTDWLPGSPAKKGPLSGQGYTLYRGEHLSEDFAAGISASAAAAQAAVQGMVDQTVAALPTDHSMAVSGAVQATALAPVSTGALAARAQTEAVRQLNIQNLNLNGVWDFTDPTTARRVVANLHKALDDYEREYA